MAGRVFGRRGAGAGEDGRAVKGGTLLRVAGCAAVIACPVATHAALATGRGVLVAAVLAAGQVGVLAAVLLRRVRAGRRAWPLLAPPLAVAGFGLAYLRAAEASVLLVSAASHAAIYGGLLALFGGSLRRGRTDLVTGMAERLRPGLTPAMRRYTRGVTRAWCAFFALQVLVSAGLGLLAPAEAWSLFVNVLDAPLVALMFLGEHVARRLVFPGYHHASIREVVRAFGQDRAAPGRP